MVYVYWSNVVDVVGVLVHSSFIVHVRATPHQRHTPEVLLHAVVSVFIYIYVVYSLSVHDEIHQLGRGEWYKCTATT